MLDSTTRAAYVETTYEETLALLVDVRDYTQGLTNTHVAPLPLAERLGVIQVISRITKRLTDVMAWLMLQKAVVAGELDADTAAEHGAARIELRDDDEFTTPMLRRLPAAVRGLADRSRRLDQKIQTLLSNQH